MKRAVLGILVVTASLRVGNVDGQLSTTTAQSCTSLASIRLPDTTITEAQPVLPGAFVPPRPFGAAGPRGALPIVAAADLPAFCRVTGIIRPSKPRWTPKSGN
jgi:hypothetical protein